LQVLLGGGNLEWNGRFSDKVIKIPSRRGPDALRLILNDFEANANGQSFLNYYDAQGKIFLQFLKPLADLTNLTEADFIDWGNADNYVKAVGVGECAGVVIDLVALYYRSKRQMTFAQEALKNQNGQMQFIWRMWFVVGAKTLLAENQKQITKQESSIYLIPFSWKQTKFNCNNFKETCVSNQDNEPTAE
jgi:sulfite reductase (ferredoxin)